MSKEINFNSEAREKLKAGVDALANAVKVTLGPKGRNVIIQSAWGSPVITKDGVTVAKDIELENPVANMGAQLTKEVASKTADMAGDGTTTATVLAQAMVTAGMKNVAAGANPMDLKRGIDKAVRAVVEDLKRQSEVVGDDYEKIKQIASISANNDEVIGSLIADAMKKVTKDGVITVEEAKGTETYIEEVKGMQFDRGYLSPFFVTDQETMACEYVEPFILISDRRVTTINDLIPVIEKTMGAGRPLVIIADEVDSQALSLLVVNRLRAQLKIVAVKAPGFGDRRRAMMEDIAILTGGTVISEDRGFTLEGVELEQLGEAGKVTITKDTTTIIDGIGNPDLIASRIKLLKSQAAEAMSDHDKEKLVERVAKLSGGVAVLYVGAPTESEMKEKKFRVDDALNATRAAVEEGVVVGGGVALVMARAALMGVRGDNEDQNTGIMIVVSALSEPLKIIAENAGVNGSVALMMVAGGSHGGVNNHGYNARTDTYEDLKAAGVIDPTKVTRVALENAASIAGMILTTECVIVDKKTEEKVPQMPGGMM